MSTSRDSESFIHHSGDSSPKHRRCRLLLPVVVISLIINIVLLVLFLTTVVFKPSLSTINVEDKSRLCFDCSYLGSDVETGDILLTIHRSGNWTLCCVEDETLRKQARQIMKTGAKESTKERSRQNKERFTNLRHGKIGAHLFIDTQALNDGDLSWLDRGSGESTSPEVKYQGHALHIATSGTYMVYSHVAIQRKFPGTHGGDTFVHRLTRYNPRQPNLGEINLLMSKHSYPEYTTRKSSFLSGALALRSGDELSIRVSDTDSVSDIPTSSYFGLIKL